MSYHRDIDDDLAEPTPNQRYHTEVDDFYDGPDETDCGKEIAIGVEDSAICDVPRTVMHTTHTGPCSLGGRASWEGGGSCAGDPLPVRNLTLTPDPL